MAILSVSRESTWHHQKKPLGRCLWLVSTNIDSAIPASVSQGLFIIWDHYMKFGGELTPQTPKSGNFLHPPAVNLVTILSMSRESQWHHWENSLVQVVTFIHTNISLRYRFPTHFSSKSSWQKICNPRHECMVGKWLGWEYLWISAFWAFVKMSVKQGTVKWSLMWKNKYARQM